MHVTSKSIHAIKTPSQLRILQCNARKVVEKKLVKTPKQSWAKKFQDLNTDEKEFLVDNNRLCNVIQQLVTWVMEFLAAVSKIREIFLQQVKAYISILESFFE